MPNCDDEDKPRTYLPLRKKELEAEQADTLQKFTKSLHMNNYKMPKN